MQPCLPEATHACLLPVRPVAGAILTDGSVVQRDGDRPVDGNAARRSGSGWLSNDSRQIPPSTALEAVGLPHSHERAENQHGRAHSEPSEGAGTLCQLALGGLHGQPWHGVPWLGQLGCPCPIPRTAGNSQRLLTLTRPPVGADAARPLGAPPGARPVSVRVNAQRATRSTAEGQAAALAHSAGSQRWLGTRCPPR